MVGLDLSPQNIEFLRERLAARAQTAELAVGDMTDFRLPRPVDAAICMQDSQGHLLTNEALVAHLRCVARAMCAAAGSTSSTATWPLVDEPGAPLVVVAPAGPAIVRATFSALNDVDSGHPGLPRAHEA